MIPQVVASERGRAQTNNVTALLGLYDCNVIDKNEVEDGWKATS